LNVLDLFSGIGGFSLGLERAGMRTVAFCEIDPYCRAVLAKHWPNVGCADDITARDFAPGEAEIVAGGFPCQDISSSGKRTGLAGEHSGLWREMLRAIRMVRPRYAIMENVADLLDRGLEQILGDLAEIGYDAEWHCIPASFVGLPQARERIWIVADPCEGRFQAGDEREPRGSLLVGWLNHDRLGEAQLAAQSCAARAWRSDDGIPRWVDRMSGLGNAVVPQIPEIIGRAIMNSTVTGGQGTGS
jgi:DNA (cytosine-5)-methyltransferase 1